MARVALLLLLLLRRLLQQRLGEGSCACSCLGKRLCLSVGSLCIRWKLWGAAEPEPAALMLAVHHKVPPQGPIRSLHGSWKVLQQQQYSNMVKAIRFQSGLIRGADCMHGAGFEGKACMGTKLHEIMTNHLL